MRFTKSHLALIISNVGFSFILIFSTLLKDSGVSSLQQVLFRTTLALIIILSVNAGKIRLKMRDLVHFMARGLVFSLFLFSALSAIALGCPVPVTTGLIHTQPLFTALIALVSKREKVSAKKFLFIIIGIVGAFIVSGIDIQQISSTNINAGVYLAVFTGFLYAIYLFLKRTEKEGYNPIQALFNTFIFAVPFTLLLGLLLKVFVENLLIVGLVLPNAYQFTLLLLFAVFSTVIPYSVLNYVKTTEVSPTTEGIMLLLDPALNIFWAMMLLGQYVTPLQYFGIALILISALMILKS